MAFSKNDDKNHQNINIRSNQGLLSARFTFTSGNYSRKFLMCTHMVEFLDKVDVGCCKQEK